MNQSFWQGKRVLLTGHTGFKGSWLSLCLQSIGAEVIGYSLEPPTKPNLFEIADIGKNMISVQGDIRDLKHLQSVFNKYQPEIVIHMAAQPLVRYSYRDPVETYSSNVMGTVNVLEAVRNSNSVKVVVNVTTDKCYENKEWLWGYRENEPMGGHDPYSSSKGCSELVTSAYRRSFMQDLGIGLASARAGNVIGGGDWSGDRLIPDILRAFEKGEAVVIRNPKSTRPWQHVLEPLSGYLILAERLYNTPELYAEGWNFGPADNDAKPVDWILDRMVKQWGGEASWQLDDGEHPHEAGYLKLDISKAKSLLDWEPTWQLDQALEKIIVWHQAWLSGEMMQKTCLKEIEEYMSDMNRLERS